MFAGFRFPAGVITVAVRWYLRYWLSYRDVEELLTERGVEVDHVTVYRWVQRFTPLFADVAGFARHSPVIAGSSTKPMSRSAACGVTSTRPSISMGRSSTSCARSVATGGTTQPAPTSEPAMGQDDLMAKLERLAALSASGVLTAEEFSAAKAKLLA